MPFFLKNLGGALIRVGALNRDYTVLKFVWEIQKLKNQKK